MYTSIRLAIVHFIANFEIVQKPYMPKQIFLINIADRDWVPNHCITICVTRILLYGADGEFMCLPRVPSVRYVGQ